MTPIMVEAEQEWLKGVGVKVEMFSGTLRNNMDPIYFKHTVNSSPVKANSHNPAKLANMSLLTLIKKWRELQAWDSNQDPLVYWAEPQVTHKNLQQAGNQLWFPYRPCQMGKTFMSFVDAMVYPVPADSIAVADTFVQLHNQVSGSHCL